MNNRKVVYRWWFVWDFEKEEEWLNRMAMDGWALDRVGFCRYEFIPCECGEYTVRTIMHGPERSYIEFIEQLGADYVGRMAGWIYFRRKSALGAFEMYSDVASKLQHLGRISKMLWVLGAANIAIGIANLFGDLHFGFVNFLCACLLMYALGRIHGAMQQLQKEGTLHE